MDLELQKKEGKEIDNKKLISIKLIHTTIWFIFASAIMYVCYAGAFNKVNRLVWFCIGAVVFEGIVLLMNKGKGKSLKFRSDEAKERSIKNLEKGRVYNGRRSNRSVGSKPVIAIILNSVI